MRQTGDNVNEDSKFKFLVNNFDGGMRRNISPAKLSDNEYALLINGRSRYGTIRPVKLPLNLSSQMPIGKFQGVYGIDSILVVFKDGKLYARDYSQLVNAFAEDHDFQMSQLADRIYAEAVPASWMNIQRKASSSVDDTAPVLFQSPVNGTPQALVCQDGDSRPRLVFSVGSSRVAKDINEWENTESLETDTREYVPIGKQMLFYDNILYIVSPDGKEIYRSVTGRPLDCVIAIDQNGNKLPNLISGKPEASRVSYAVDFNPITCIRSFPVPMTNDTTAKPPFFVGTLKNSWAVYPDYNFTLFKEPTFTKLPMFNSGPLNQFAFTDLLGDTAFISDAGLTTFNSIATLSNEGKNAPFFDDIFKIFDGIVQDVTAAITSDNYGLFAVKTIYGYGILVYDTQREKWTSLDIYPEVTGAIKQFTEIKVNGRRRLFFITESQIFEMYASETTATCSLYCREFEDQDTEIQLLPRRVRVVLRDIEENGTITLTPFADGKRGTPQTQAISQTAAPIVPPLALPFGAGATRTSVTKTFTIEEAEKGHTIGVFITINFIGDIIEILPVSEGDIRDVSDAEAGDIYDEAKTN